MNENKPYHIAALTIAITFVMQLIFQFIIWQKSKQDRQNDLGDKEAVVYAAKEAVIAAHNAATSAQIAAKTSYSAMNDLHIAVKEVGVQAVAAYTEANCANKNIQEVQNELSLALNIPVNKG